MFMHNTLRGEFGDSNDSECLQVESNDLREIKKWLYTRSLMRDLATEGKEVHDIEVFRTNRQLKSLASHEYIHNFHKSSQEASFSEIPKS
jgi:hypothetical protein